MEKDFRMNVWFQRDFLENTQKIKITKDTLLDTDISFDPKTGEIRIKGSKAHTLPINTHSYKFFKGLYEHIGEYICHEKIFKYLYGDIPYVKTKNYGTFSTIKSKLPAEVRKYVFSQKEAYMLVRTEYFKVQQKKAKK